MIGRGVGCVVRTLGESVLASLPTAAIGDGVCIRVGAGTLRGQVVAIDRSRVTIVPFGSLAGISIGDRVEVRAAALAAPVGFGLLGRAISANGEPLDGRGRVHAASVVAGAHAAPAPGDRLPVNYPFFTGIRAIDGLLSIGRGARIGFFGAPGAGKSTLLETIAAGASGDAVVLALVGERGREAQRWFERLDARTTIVCATSDRGAAERIRAADVAMEHAAYLRARGLHVVLVVDSLARYANSLREARVALGEPVGRGGYPPSVWAHLARYVERAGNGSSGSITLLATVLTDGSDEREPLADAARSLLDDRRDMTGKPCTPGADRTTGTRGGDRSSRQGTKSRDPRDETLRAGRAGGASTHAKPRRKRGWGRFKHTFSEPPQRSHPPRLPTQLHPQSPDDPRGRSGSQVRRHWAGRARMDGGSGRWAARADRPAGVPAALAGRFMQPLDIHAASRPVRGFVAP